MKIPLKVPCVCRCMRILIGLSLTSLASSHLSLAANLPLTDLIFYGKVYQKTTHAPISGTLPGKVEVKINNLIAPADTVIASTADLKTIPGALAAEYYVLRIKRYEVGTPRLAPDTFAMPGDRIRIFLNGVEVADTETSTVLATDAATDIRLLNLNGTPTADSDGDGLPDSWEQSFLGGLTQGAGGDSNSDGVSNFLAFALGLNPNANNASRLPFLSLDQNGALVFYFRQSAQPSGISYLVKASDSLTGNTWVSLSGITPQEIGAEGDSRILKVTIPNGVDRPQRFFRLEVSPP